MALPTELTCVLRLMNCYAALHVKGDTKIFISERPEQDLKVAQATAKIFAEARGIPYDSKLNVTNQPLITVIKQEEKWYPAELYPDKVSLLISYLGTNLGSSQQNAITLATAIALDRGTDCIPSIGISLSP